MKWRMVTYCSFITSFKSDIHRPRRELGQGRVAGDNNGGTKPMGMDACAGCAVGHQGADSESTDKRAKGAAVVVVVQVVVVVVASRHYHHR
jgi:hypothetical protein